LFISHEEQKKTKKKKQTNLKYISIVYIIVCILDKIVLEAAAAATFD
jgi:glycopeptide antibiotics resistance protein